MNMHQKIIQFWEVIESVVKLIISLVGTGAIGKVFWRKYTQYRKKHSFDRAMDVINKQNKILAKRLGAYVNRPTLNVALERIQDQKCRVCAVKGSAGSGKTRFALNMIKRNKPFSKYCYVYINKNNASYFDSDEFRTLRTIPGNRNYIFIFDYVYENIERIKFLINVAEQTHRHKFILIERDYTGMELPNNYEISMTEHKMDMNLLCKVFLNALPTRMRRAKKVQSDAKNLIELIYSKIDQENVRPVFAELSADIYRQDSAFSEKIKKNVSSYSDLIKLYWNKKFTQINIEGKCSNYAVSIGEAFMTNIDLLMRCLLLIAAVTKKDIIVEFENTHLKFTLEGDRDITELINTYCEKSFIKSIESLPLEGVREIFGVILKDSIIVNKVRRENKFKIVSQLDIISEWLMSDSLADKSNHWIGHLRLFLRNNFNSDMCRFMARGALDFPELIQYFESSLSYEVDSNEFLAYIHYSLQRIYEMNEASHIDISLITLNKFIQDTQVSSRETFRIIQNHSWIILKEIYCKNLDKTDVTKKIIQILEGGKYE